MQSLDSQKVSLYSNNEENILPICIKNRNQIFQRYSFIQEFVIDYFKCKQQKTNEKKIVDTLPIYHIISCPKCINWFHHVVPDSVLKRQKRITEYCCASLYCAVEETGKANSIRFTMFRGEDPCWSFAKQYDFINYCPWCGVKLPDKAF